MGRAAQIGVSILASLVAACGGAGEGDTSGIPPFWLLGQVVFADLDRNGLDDVAITATYVAAAPPHPGYVWVYLQSSPRILEARRQFSVGPDPTGLAVGDVDGDGVPDLVASSSATKPPEINVVNTSGAISILRQDPSARGSFASTATLSTGGSAYFAAIGRLTGDPLPDIVVVDHVSVHGRAVLFGQSPSAQTRWLPPVDLPLAAGIASMDVAVADMNGDALGDIVFAAADGVRLFYQRANGGFDAAAPGAGGFLLGSVAVADLDGDGRPDIVATASGNASSGGTGGSYVFILRQTLPGSFATTSVAVPDGARDAAIGDLDGDTIPDIAVVSLVYQSRANSRISVLLQSRTSRGQFSGYAFDGPFSGSHVAIGDATGDGYADLVVNDGDTDEPSVYPQSLTVPGTFGGGRPLR